jgi:CO/xanthine dehydrogenase Mo-binding subunit
VSKPLGYVHLVRSQVDAGDASVDLEAARAMPGVLDVLSAADVAGQVLPGGMPVLAHSIQYQGQPVAAVVATSEYLAADAAEAVDVEISTSDVRADAPGSPDDDTRTDTDMLTAVVDQPRWHVAPLQTSQCLVEPGDEAGDLVVRTPARDPQGFARDLARVLGLEPTQVRVEASPHRGRSVNVGDVIAAGHAVAATAALRLGSPVRWQESRAESLTSGGAEAGVQAVARLDRAPETGALSLGIRLTFEVGAAALPSTADAAAVRALPWYGFDELRVDEVERTSHLPPAYVDAARIVGQVLAAESALTLLSRVTGEPLGELRDQLADEGGAAALLASVRADGGTAEVDGERCASGFALAPGVAASVTIRLDAGTGEWAPSAIVLAAGDDGPQDLDVVHSLRAGALDGYGIAAMQQIPFDAQGTCLAATLMDYVMPSSAEAPSIEIRRVASDRSTAVGPDLARHLATAAVAAACRDAVTSLLGAAADLPSPVRSSDAWAVANA